MTVNEIPGWARWIAMDKDGTWWCYEAEPHQHDKGWYENEVGRSCKINPPRQIARHWQQSLTRLGG